MPQMRYAASSEPQTSSSSSSSSSLTFLLFHRSLTAAARARIPNLLAVHLMSWNLFRQGRSCTCAAGVLASGGEDGAIAVWNLTAAAEGQNVLSTVMRQEEEKGIRIPPQLLFQHFGHRATVCQPRS